jgi:hypothetical protein
MQDHHQQQRVLRAHPNGPWCSVKVHTTPSQTNSCAVANERRSMLRVVKSYETCRTMQACSAADHVAAVTQLHTLPALCGKQLQHLPVVERLTAAVHVLPCWWVLDFQQSGFRGTASATSTRSYIANVPTAAVACIASRHTIAKARFGASTAACTACRHAKEGARGDPGAAACCISGRPHRGEARFIAGSSPRLDYPTWVNTHWQQQGSS